MSSFFSDENGKQLLQLENVNHDTLADFLDQAKAIMSKPSGGIFRNPSMPNDVYAVADSSRNGILFNVLVQKSSGKISCDKKCIYAKGCGICPEVLVAAFHLQLLPKFIGWFNKRGGSLHRRTGLDNFVAAVTPSGSGSKEKTTRKGAAKRNPPVIGLLPSSNASVGTGKNLFSAKRRAKIWPVRSKARLGGTFHLYRG